jgi:hypothetical protein
MPKFKENPSPLKYGKKSSNFKMKNPIKQMGMMSAAMGAAIGTGGGTGGLYGLGGHMAGANPRMGRSKIYHSAHDVWGRGRKK